MLRSIYLFAGRIVHKELLMLKHAILEWLPSGSISMACLCVQFEFDVNPKFYSSTKKSLSSLRKITLHFLFKVETKVCHMITIQSDNHEFSTAQSTKNAFYTS